jgi:hypothetical protein
MAGNLVRIMPRNEGGGEADPSKWIGRIAIFELVTGSRVQGRILAYSEKWIDTDNGAIQVIHIAYARWVGAEEASIIRANSPYGDPNRRLR